MQINKIRIHNINSLRGTWEIDFTKEPFISSSLFAITGPTGSGKSTILDSITLALFNRIPRLNKSISKDILSQKGFLLTRNEKDCFVELEYTCGSGSFCSKWSTRITRNKTQGDYEMELVDLSTGKPLDISKSEIPSRNEFLIGLNYEQFLRAILLAQGAFSAFLDSNGNERAKLLEDISGTGIYRKLGIKAFEIYKLKHAEIESKEALLIEIGRQIIDENEVNNLAQELSSIDKDLKNKRDLERRLNSLIEVKKRLKGYEEELQQVNGQIDALAKRSEVFNSDKKIKLDRHRELIPYEVGIRNFMRNTERAEEVEKLISQLNSKIKEQQQLRDKLLTEIRQFLNQGIDSINAGNAISNLNEYRDKVLDIQTDLQDKNSKFQNQENSTAQLLRSGELLEFGWKISEEELLEKIQQQQKEIAIQISNGENRGWILNELESLIGGIIHRQEALLELKGRINEFINLNREVKDLEGQQAILENELVEESVLESFEKEVELIQVKLEQLNEEMLRMVRESKEGITSLREALVEQEPCPVCGSLEHPYAGKYIDKLDDHRKQIEEVKNQHKEKIAALDKMKKSRVQTQATILQIEKRIQSNRNSLEPLKEIIELLKDRADISEVKNIKIIEEKIAEEKVQLQLLQEHQGLYNKQSELKQVEEAVLKLSALKSEKLTVELALEKVYTGKNINSDCNGFIDAFNTIQQEIISREQQLVLYLEEQSKLKNASDLLQSALRSPLNILGFAGIIEAFKTLLNPTDLDTYSTEEAILKNEASSLNSRLIQVQKSIETENQKDLPGKSIEQCREELQLITEWITEADKSRAELAGKLSANNERINLVTQLQQEIGKKIEQNRPWKLLNDLIGDKTGNKFNSFAQELTMTKLIKLTNVHLVQFNDRYTLSMPGSNDEDLVIIDGYMGNERRSVKTLSGGEKFMVSLSLALSMSEMASQQVKIKSLFIDEGISTLDPETLDQVVSTLEQLQSGTQKTIGIISHVEALKDRIVTQIRLEKSSTGFSTMNIH